MACGEFSLIARYFDRVRSSRLDVELGIGDDCALLNIPEKQSKEILASYGDCNGTLSDRFSLQIPDTYSLMQAASVKKTTDYPEYKDLEDMRYLHWLLFC